MAEIKIIIDFKKYQSHPQLVSDLSQAFNATEGDTVDFQIYLSTYYKMLYSDFLVLVCSVVHYLRAKGIKNIGNIHFDPNDNKALYASRVDFFETLNLSSIETYPRKSGIGRFIEITQYDKTNIKSVFTQILNIVLNNVGVTDNIKGCLNLCFWEIMDNVLNHSDLPNKYEGKGWCSAQYFPYLSEIRIIICDTGIGIQKALQFGEDENLKLISNRDAIQICTDLGVTNGHGRGFGLFVTSEFIKENGGEMIVYSGDHFSETMEKDRRIKKGDHWQGTFVYLKINTNIFVDYELFMTGFSHLNLEEDFYESLENFNNLAEDLW